MVLETGRQRILSGWGGRPRSRALVVRPRGEQDVRRSHPRGVIARGLGRSYGDAAQNAGGVVLDMTAWEGILGVDPAESTVTALAGTSFSSLLSHLVPRGFFVPVSPGTRHVTLGGAIAADVHGKNHHRDGSIGRHVASLRLATPHGETLDLSPDDGDPFWATVGGMGLTGTILEATLRVLPIESPWVRVDTERTGDLEATMARMSEDDHRYRYSVAWVDLLARGGSLGRSILIRGEHAAAGEDGERPARPLDGQAPVTVPEVFPSGVLNRATARAFNEVWFRRAPRRERGRLRSLSSFFYPLDAIGDWNRLYGSRGFLQYQFVVPFGAEAALRSIVQRLSDARCPSFLTVLKRFGHQEGLLSFPVAGWTLALDIPLGRPGLGELLDACDRTVAEAGGRVYLAKDSRLRPQAFAEMYPELGRWREARARLDPAGALRSDLGRRLGLVG